MISTNPGDLRPRLAEAPELLREKESCRVIAIVSIIQIARQEEDLSVLAQTVAHQAFEGAARSRSYFLNRSTFVIGQVPQRAVEVEICSVDNEHEKRPRTLLAHGRAA
jgi:hypothetical protein